MEEIFCLGNTKAGIEAKKNSLPSTLVVLGFLYSFPSHLSLRGEFYIYVGDSFLSLRFSCVKVPGKCDNSPQKQIYA